MLRQGREAVFSAPLKVRLLLAVLSAPLLIPMARLFGWISYGVRSARANILLDLWCVLFVAGVWFGVYDWSKTKDRPAEVRRKPPLVQIPLLQQVIGFIVGSASQLALGNGVQWILDHLIPWLVQEVFGVFVLSFGVGALIGCSIFDGGRMFRD